MEFEINNIGKLVMKYYHKNREINPFNPPPTFEFIVGYDYLNNAYLTIDFTWWTGNYSKIHNESPFYTVEEALHLLDERKTLIEKTKEDLIEKAFFYDKVRENLKQTNKTNYQNEMLHLSNAYYESLRQKHDLEMYISGSSEEYQKMYARELASTEKAIRRLEKRFNFFFGDQAEYVKECIRAAGPHNTMKRSIKILQDNVEKIEKQKQTLVKRAEKFAKKETVE